MKSGYEILNDPFLNKGTAFTKEEKKKGFWYNVSQPKLHKEKPFYE